MELKNCTILQNSHPSEMSLKARLVLGGQIRENAVGVMLVFKLKGKIIIKRRANNKGEFVEKTITTSIRHQSAPFGKQCGEAIVQFSKGEAEGDGIFEIYATQLPLMMSTCIGAKGYVGVNQPELFLFQALWGTGKLAKSIDFQFPTDAMTLIFAMATIEAGGNDVQNDADYSSDDEAAGDNGENAEGEVKVTTIQEQLKAHLPKIFQLGTLDKPNPLVWSVATIGAPHSGKSEIWKAIDSTISSRPGTMQGFTNDHYRRITCDTTVRQRGIAILDQVGHTMGEQDDLVKSMEMMRRYFEMLQVRGFPSGIPPKATMDEVAQFLSTNSVGGVKMKGWIIPMDIWTR